MFDHKSSVPVVILGSEPMKAKSKQHGTGFIIILKPIPVAFPTRSGGNTCVEKKKSMAGGKKFEREPINQSGETEVAERY
jgi:hypothetical protein